MFYGFLVLAEKLFIVEMSGRAEFRDTGEGIRRGSLSGSLVALTRGLAVRGDKLFKVLHFCKPEIR